MRTTDKIVTPNTTLLVSLAEFKEHVNWPSADTSQDTVMTAYIKAATENAKQFTGREFLNTTWQLLLNNFPSRIALTKSPVSSVTSVSYYNSDNVLTTLSADEYQVVEGGEYGFAGIVFDGNIPSTYNKEQNVVIEYVSGYGSATSNVPEAIRVAVMMQAANWFANRESEQTGTNVVQLANGVQHLLYPYKTFYHNYV